MTPLTAAADHAGIRNPRPPVFVVEATLALARRPACRQPALHAVREITALGEAPSDRGPQRPLRPGCLIPYRPVSPVSLPGRAEDCCCYTFYYSSRNAKGPPPLGKGPDLRKLVAGAGFEPATSGLLASRAWSQPGLWRFAASHLASAEIAAWAAASRAVAAYCGLSWSQSRSQEQRSSGCAVPLTPSWSPQRWSQGHQAPSLEKWHGQAPDAAHHVVSRRLKVTLVRRGR
jgi:hypothetical protein